MKYVIKTHIAFLHTFSSCKIHFAVSAIYILFNRMQNAMINISNCNLLYFCYITLLRYMFNQSCKVILFLYFYSSLVGLIKKIY